MADQAQHARTRGVKRPAHNDPHDDEPPSRRQRTEQANNTFEWFTEQLAAKDRCIQQLELKVTGLSYLEGANQRLKDQVVCVQTRGLFEQLSAKTHARAAAKDSSTNRWKQWTENVVRAFWKMSPKEQKSHPFYIVKMEGNFTSADNLISWMQSLYDIFSDEVHNIDTRLLIDESSVRSVHKRREKILMRAMNPTSFDRNGDVDFEKERKRYQAILSHTDDHYRQETRGMTQGGSTVPPPYGQRGPAAPAWQANLVCDNCLETGHILSYCRESRVQSNVARNRAARCQRRRDNGSARHRVGDAVRGGRRRQDSGRQRHSR